MENLIIETNNKIHDIIDGLGATLDEYKAKLNNNAKDIETQLATVQNYRLEFFASKEKIEKMNSDIEGFEEDYKKLVERFKDDELANILVAANKEISAKIEERKKQIMEDRISMNEIVKKAEAVKKKLVKLNAEKKALELCLEKILDAHEFYSKALNQVVEYTQSHDDNLCACFYDETISDMIENEQNSNDDLSADELENRNDNYVIVDKDEVVETSPVVDEELLEEIHEAILNDEEVPEEINEIASTAPNFENSEITLDEDPIEIDVEDVEEADPIIIEHQDLEIDEDDLLEEDIKIELAVVEDDDDETEANDDDNDDDDDESIYIPEEDEDNSDLVIDENVFADDADFEEEDLFSDFDVEKMSEINVDDIEPTDEDFVIEGEEHEVVMDSFPSQEIDFDDELDLEKLINFTDELEDE